jgi:hypothetical protein
MGRTRDYERYYVAEESDFKLVIAAKSVDRRLFSAPRAEAADCAGAVREEQIRRRVSRRAFNIDEPRIDCDDGNRKVLGERSPSRRK